MANGGPAIDGPGVYVGALFHQQAHFRQIHKGGEKRRRSTTIGGIDVCARLDEHSHRLEVGVQRGVVKSRGATAVGAVCIRPGGERTPQCAKIAGAKDGKQIRIRGKRCCGSENKQKRSNKLHGRRPPWQDASQHSLYGQKLRRRARRFQRLIGLIEIRGRHGDEGLLEILAGLNELFEMEGREL